MVHAKHIELIEEKFVMIQANQIFEYIQMKTFQFSEFIRNPFDCLLIHGNWLFSKKNLSFFLEI